GELAQLSDRGLDDGHRQGPERPAVEPAPTEQGELAGVRRTLAPERHYGAHGCAVAGSLKRRIEPGARGRGRGGGAGEGRAGDRGLQAWTEAAKAHAGPAREWP